MPLVPKLKFKLLNFCIKGKQRPTSTNPVSRPNSPKEASETAHEQKTVIKQDTKEASSAGSSRIKDLKNERKKALQMWNICRKSRSQCF